MQHLPAGGRAVARRATRAPVQGPPGPCVTGPGPPRPRGHRQHTGRIPPLAARGPDRCLSDPAQRVRECEAVQGRRPPGGARACRCRARTVRRRRGLGRRARRPVVRAARGADSGLPVAVAGSCAGAVTSRAAGRGGGAARRADPAGPAGRGGAGRTAALRGSDRRSRGGPREVCRLPAAAARRAGQRPGPRAAGRAPGAAAGRRARDPPRRPARAQPAARPGRRHRRRGRPAAHVPGHVDRGHRRAGQDPSRARGQRPV